MRKSRIPLKILECLATRGKLSKGMVEAILEDHYHQDILKGFKRLEENGWIVPSGSKTGRGRRQFFFEITPTGLAQLIVDDSITPSKFWVAVMGFCFHSDDKIIVDKVEKFYDLFIDKYQKYSPQHGYYLMIDSVNKSCNDWLQNQILRAGKVTLDQIILESLALNPTATLKQLVQSIKGFNEYEIKEVLSSYSIPRERDPAFTGGYRIGKLNGAKHPLKLVLYNPIKVMNNANGIKTYELSLFGVLLVLLVVRRRDMNKLKYGLYFKDKSFEEYYDKIASNYRHKLPLIFGKWHLLKRILGVFALYNFDIILNDKIRSKTTYQDSDGNKELNECTKSIILRNHEQLDKIRLVGLDESSKFVKSKIDLYRTGRTINEAYTEVRNKIDAVFELLDEMTVVGGYQYVVLRSHGRNKPLTQSYIEDAKTGNLVDSEESERLSRLYQIDNAVEKQLADQITFLYYLSLLTDNYSRIGNYKMEYLESTMSGLPKRTGQKVLKSRNSAPKVYNNNQSKRFQPPFHLFSIPSNSLLFFSKEKLLEILRYDDEIKGWFWKWLNDIINYQEEALERMNSIKEFLGKV